MNLRELVETDLDTTLEGEWGLPVTLISPDGVIQTLKKNTTTRLAGQVLYDTVQQNPETGEIIMVDNPIVSLRRTSLDRIPQDGEKWVVQIPTTPSTTAALEDFVLSPTKAHGGGGSIGYIKLYLTRVNQS